MRHCWIAGLVLVAPCISISAQRGRAFVSIEAHVGTASTVHVGFVKQLEPIEYEIPKDGFYPGKPYRVTFTVSETIKGVSAKSMNLVLCLQHTFNLEYLRDNRIEVMLVGTNQYLDEHAEIGLERPGMRYSFRILQPILFPTSSPSTEWTGQQLNVSQNSGRMFDLNLDVISRRDEILKRARAFAKKHPEVLQADYIGVPNEFAVKCGYTDAYCLITLPLCPESKKLAHKLEKKPDRLLKDVKEADLPMQRKAVMDSIRLFLTHFEAKAFAGLYWLSQSNPKNVVCNLTPALRTVK
jgi:hypothetical protein